MLKEPSPKYFLNRTQNLASIKKEYGNFKFLGFPKTHEYLTFRYDKEAYKINRLRLIILKPQTTKLLISLI